jgi:hypothetical protein
MYEYFTASIGQLPEFLNRLKRATDEQAKKGIADGRK